MKIQKMKMFLLYAPVFLCLGVMSYWQVFDPAIGAVLGYFAGSLLMMFAIDRGWISWR